MIGKTIHSQIDGLVVKDVLNDHTEFRQDAGTRARIARASITTSRKPEDK